MRTLKHISGIFIAAVGIFFLLGALAEMFDSRSGTPAYILVLTLFGWGVLPIVAGIKLLRSAGGNARQKICPHCGSNERAPAGLLISNYHSYMVHLGGALLSALWGASRDEQVRCTQCDTLYFTPTRGSRIAGALLWIFVLLWLFTIIVEELET